MFRPTLLFSILTAMLSAENSPTKASDLVPTTSTQPSQIAIYPVSEEQLIVDDARRAIGRELCEE